MARSNEWKLLLALLGLALGACSGSGGTGPPETDPIPTTITAVEGIGLEAPAGTVLPMGPTVLIRDQDGFPMAGVGVHFRVLEGGGTAVVFNRNTGSNGRARSTWILGEVAGGPQRFEAEVVGTGLKVEFEATTIVPVPGESYKGRGGYTEYLAGEIPVILSAPHGGNLRPDEIDDRTEGVTGSDTNTRDLIMRIRAAIRAEVGFYPHIIISHLHRIKLDPNREIVEASQGDPESERAWWEFQTFIDEARETVEETHGEGFYIDLHGHGHAIPRLELGYMLSSADLGRSDELLATQALIEKSSVRALASKAGGDFAALIRGPLSLGTFLEAEGYPAVPSQSQPNPGNDPYFSGGYNTGRHGSRNGGMVSGVQIECNFPGVRDTAANRQAFAESLARVLAPFFAAHFDIGLTPVPSSVPPPTGSLR